MELSTITRPRPVALAIPLADEVLHVEYDAAVGTIELIARGNIYDILATILLDWDLTREGQKELPEAFDRTAAAEERAKLLLPFLYGLPITFLREVEAAIEQDFMAPRRQRKG